ncbi:unnamed protein product [Moneuplotes crassus]|uniref:Uncharacterized protein n=2 Tax=Euplotes crassus TaxID=5936 RepID=A0AAD1Y9A7_EUPCR|nr:unnamed protein product [Moneuplotes crassus]
MEEAPQMEKSNENKQYSTFKAQEDSYGVAQVDNTKGTSLYKLEGGETDEEAQFSKSEQEMPEEHTSWFSFKKLWLYTGPGWLMSIAYLDPGNIEGDLLAGTHGGYGLIWTLFLATFCGLIIQILSARVGIVTGRDLAVLCREQFNKPMRLTLWVMAEIAIIGSDIQEVIGTAIAFKILFGFPIWVGAIITILDTFTFLFIHACGVRKLEAVFAVLVGTMAICFWCNMFIVLPDAGDVMKGFIPQLPKDSTGEMIGLIGAVIMPHNLFLHSALVQSRKINRHNNSKVKEANKYFAIEAGVSLFISFLINLAVVATFAYYHLKTGSSDIVLNNAHFALQESFGTNAKYIWAIGLMAAGQSSTMTGTYAGQFVMQGFINLHVPAYVRVFITRAIAIVPAIIFAFIKYTDNLDGFLNILQAIQLPFALIPLLKFSASPKIMKDYKNHMFWNLFCIAVSLTLMALNVYGLIPSTKNPWIIAGTTIGFLIYFGIIIAVLLSPVHNLAPLQSEIEESKTFAELEEEEDDSRDEGKPLREALLNRSSNIVESSTL